MTVTPEAVRISARNCASRELRRDIAIAVVYAGSGILWILFSTYLLPRALNFAPEAMQRFELVKGYLFMVATSLLFFLLLRAHSRHQQTLRSEIESSEAMANHHAQVLGMLASGNAAETCLLELIRGIEQQRAPVVCCVASLNTAAEVQHVYAPSLPLDFCRKTAETGVQRTATSPHNRLVIADVATDPLVVDIRADLLAQGMRACCWLRMTEEDGTTLGILAMFYPHPGPPTARDMRVAERALATARVILEHDRTRSLLADSERVYRDLVEEAPVGVCIASDVSNQFKAVNPALAAMLGYSSRGEVENLALDRDVYTDPAERQVFFSTLREHGACDMLMCWRRRDGRRLVIRCQATVIQRDDASVTARIFCEDVSAKQEMEARTQQAQRLESIGRLAGGIAHDFNNILMVTQSYAELLEPLLAENEQGGRFVREIIKASGRAADLTRQLLAFSRKQPFTPEPVDLNERIRGSLTSWTRLLGRRARVTTTLAESLPHCLMDSAQLEQVLLNLLLNARDAMPEGGEIAIETSLDREGPQPRVCLRLTDSGKGIAPDVLPNIFDPFFTTKDPGKGTGLGLASVYGIVERAGGDVKVTSTIGEGTSFRVYLPIAEKPAVPQSATPPVAQSGMLTGTILIVEDEEAILETLSAVSRDMGLRVLNATCGEEALRILEREENVHLMVTDVVMPGMSGFELVEIARLRFPSTRVLVVSGYARGEEELSVEHHEFLLKPIGLDHFRNKVRRMFDTAQK